MMQLVRVDVRSKHPATLPPLSGSKHPATLPPLSGSKHPATLPPLSGSKHPATVPPLSDGEHHHIFISYSSTDTDWTHNLIEVLESHGLRVCYHERDFVPGRTVLENMSDCIQESQKVLLVLSSEFVRSRWCLLEANMSLFRSCFERNPIVPVLLEPGISIPLHLCHLTYLEARDLDFISKLLKVLCTSNRHLQANTVAPFQPPSIYNGKVLQPLTAVNQEVFQKWEAGRFSDMEVPDQLRLVIKDPNTYLRAVRIVNDVSESKVWFRSVWLRSLMYIAAAIVGCVLTILIDVAIPVMERRITNFNILYCYTFQIVPLSIFVRLVLWKREEAKYILGEMQKAVGQANALHCHDKVLMGCCSNSNIAQVYVSLDGCRREFTETFSEHTYAEEMFHRALVFFSSGYACCLAKRHFPFLQPSATGHLEGGVCFCQYVSQQLSRGEWK